MDPDLRRIDSYLKGKSCVYTPSWLQECVEYYRSELNGAINFEELCSQVLGQWCLLDLSDIAIPSLPPRLGSKAKFEMTGSYALQVVRAMDISVSAYTQHQQLRRADTDNLDVDEERRAAGPTEPRGKRMMHLLLTDGVQEVSANEHQPIKLFDRTLVPGCKVLVTGPLTSRRGILFLCERNIALLGGEVDSLLVPNALENVLARKLGLPENPDPYRLQPADGVPNIAAPTATQTDWEDDLWEQDLVQQLPEILNAADANHASVNLENNIVNRARSNTDQTSASRGRQANSATSHQRHDAFDNGVVSNHTNDNRRTEPFGNCSNNTASDRQNALGRHGIESIDNGWSTTGYSGFEASGSRANNNVSRPCNEYQGGGDFSPSSQKPAAFTLSDSEDELLQAVDVEAAIRMTQMVRPNTNLSPKASPIDDQNRMDFASQQHIDRRPQVEFQLNENRINHAEIWLKEEEMEEQEFQPPVSRRQTSWQKEVEDEEMEFEPQTCFPRRNEYISPERVARYQPTKPMTRQEALEALRAKRLKGRAAAGTGISDAKPPSPKDNPQTNAEETGGTVTTSDYFTKPGCSRYGEDIGRDSRTARMEASNTEPPPSKRAGIKPEPFKPEPPEPEQLEPEPMDTMPEPSENVSRGPVALGTEPFVYLAAVDAGRPGGRHVVKATVLQLCSGLRAQGNRWHLDAEIADGAGTTLFVKFANSVLESLTGYSVPQVAALKRQIATNPLIKERLHEDLQQARQRLVELNCLMTLEVRDDSSVEVVSLTQMKDAHWQALKDRNSRITHHE